MASTKVLEVVSAIHRKVREQEASYEFSTVLEDWSNELARLTTSYNEVYCARHLVGSTPQLPNTLLGILGGWVIGIAQRMLFWYTPQIRQFHEATTTAMSRLCSLEEQKFRSILSIANRLERLEKESRQTKARIFESSPPNPTKGTPVNAAKPDPSESTPFSASKVDTDHFYLQLQRRFQSREKKDVSRLETYLSVLESLDPSIPSGRWLDIGSGDGQWLQRVQAAGYEAIGVDANPSAIAECRDKGIEAVQGDALDHLRHTGDGSFAVISAFHVLEHCPFEYSLNLIHQAARVLEPGGVLVVETPNPGNVLMAAEQFWLDPTHQRPIPMPLTEFAFEYCGLRILHRFEVNPRGESEYLPFRELELSYRLNQLLYGPQDYALMGRHD